MENVVLEIEGNTDYQNQTADVIDELGALQLAIIGGGCAEVCPY